MRKILLIAYISLAGCNGSEVEKLESEKPGISFDECERNDGINGCWAFDECEYDEEMSISLKISLHVEPDIFEHRLLLHKDEQCSGTPFDILYGLPIGIAYEVSESVEVFNAEAVSTLYLTYPSLNIIEDAYVSYVIEDEKLCFTKNIQFHLAGMRLGYWSQLIDYDNCLRKFSV